jgi:hypothetical protein
MKKKLNYILRILAILVFVFFITECSEEDSFSCENVEQGDFVLVE